MEFIEILKTQFMVGMLESFPDACPLHLLYWRFGAVSFAELIFQGYWKNPTCPKIGKRCLWDCPEIKDGS